MRAKKCDRCFKFFEPEKLKRIDLYFNVFCIYYVFFGLSLYILIQLKPKLNTINEEMGGNSDDR